VPQWAIAFTEILRDLLVLKNMWQKGKFIEKRNGYSGRHVGSIRAEEQLMIMWKWAGKSFH
jgi:hypothetical protein